MESNIIYLTPEQREELSLYTRKGYNSAMLIRRARCILALDRSNKKDHLRIGRICETLEISRQALCDIRRDFLNSGSVGEFLTRKKREEPPVPAKITGEVEARIIALACSNPPEGASRWTVRLLAKKAVELKYIDSLSHMSVDRLLKKRNISLT